MIAINIDARTVGKKGSGFAVQLRCGKFVWCRTMRVERATANYAELRAFEYALKSIKPEFMNQEVEIESSGRYASMMLERDDSGWKRNPKTFVDDVKQIRVLVEKFSKISAKKGSDSNLMKELRSLNEKTICGEDEIFTKDENVSFGGKSMEENTTGTLSTPVGQKAVVEKKIEPKPVEEPKLEAPETPKQEPKKPETKTVVEKSKTSADPTLVNLLSSLSSKKS